jgi:hypothetical protein
MQESKRGERRSGSRDHNTRKYCLKITRNGNRFHWVQASQPFLLLLIGYEVGKDDQPVARKKGRATIKKALEASNAAFKRK